MVIGRSCARRGRIENAETLYKIYAESKVQAEKQNGANVLKA